MHKDIPELLTFKQLNNYFGIPRTTAYRYMKTCAFPRPVQLGPKSVRFRKDELLEWLDNRPHVSAYRVEDLT